MVGRAEGAGPAGRKCEDAGCLRPAIAFSEMRLWWVCDEHAYGWERDR